MKISRTSFRIACALTLFLTGVTVVIAQATNASGTITRLATGWNYDQIYIETTAPVINPAMCPNPSGYASNKDVPGFKTHYQAAMLAFSLDKPVIVVVSSTLNDCVAGFPKIWGIDVRKQ